MIAGHVRQMASYLKSFDFCDIRRFLSLFAAFDSTFSQASLYGRLCTLYRVGASDQSSAITGDMPVLFSLYTCADTCVCC